jgi:hypothetical protein
MSASRLREEGSSLRAQVREERTALHAPTLTVAFSYDEPPTAPEAADSGWVISTRAIASACCLIVDARHEPP